MSIFAIVRDHVRAAMAALQAEGRVPSGLDLSRVMVETPREASHGDMASNVAMVFAKDCAMKPRDLAAMVVEKLLQVPAIAKAEIAGPGFINLTLHEDAWIAGFGELLRAGVDFGRVPVGAGLKVNVEYVSANPTGPMHVGHCRGAVVGDALASLLEQAGFDVTREYYINDAGAQVDVLARSAFLRYREALGEEIGAIPEGLYPGDYLKPVGEALAKAHGRALLDQPESAWIGMVRQTAIDMMMDMIRDDLAALNVRHDVFFSERSLVNAGTDKVARALETLRVDGHVYQGRLAPPKGAPIEDWEDREQTLFRATASGDDVDRPLKKSDGGYTYFASDIAYHQDKFLRGFRTMIDVWGADHGGYVKRMQAAVRAVSGGQAELDIKLIQLVRLLRNGEPVKMSKRAGDFVTLRDVVEEVGRDAVRFMMLFRKNDATLDFDLAKVIEQSRDNAVFYVQYAHARGASVLRNAQSPGLVASDEEIASLAVLSDPGELALIKKLLDYPRLIEQAALAHEPHRVAFYLDEVAALFHSQWNRGKDAPHLRFIIEDNEKLGLARLALVRGALVVLQSGLNVLGVSAPDEMR
jgi:arginyl-tRNA synthetase